jgi:hypothetical protein
MSGGRSITLTPATLRLIDGAALAIVALWAIALLLGLPPTAPTTDSMAMVDYGLNTRQAVIIDAMVAKALQGQGAIVYPNHYAYPPAFVVLMLLWLKLGTWAYSAWLALILLSLFAALVAGARFAHVGLAPGRLAIAALAVLVAIYPLGWDLRTRNVNLVYLAVALLGLAAADRRPATGGMLLSLSAALKLYSVLFLPWLAWRRQWRVLGWMTGGIVFWFVLLPVAWFGWRGAWHLTWAWLEALRVIGEPGYQEIFPGYLVTLPRAVAFALAGPADDPGVTAVVRGLQLAWAGFVLWRLWRGGLSPAGEASLLMLLPLPLAPLLQPHHLVVFLLPGMVLLAEAARAGATKRGRIVVAITLLGAFFLMQSGPAGGGRALATMLTTLLLAAALGQRKRL